MNKIVILVQNGTVEYIASSQDMEIAIVEIIGGEDSVRFYSPDYTGDNLADVFDLTGEREINKRLKEKGF